LLLMGKKAIEQIAPGGFWTNSGAKIGD
jgi:hypothetical protein